MRATFRFAYSCSERKRPDCMDPASPILIFEMTRITCLLAWRPFLRYFSCKLGGTEPILIHILKLYPESAQFPIVLNLWYVEQHGCDIASLGKRVQKRSDSLPSFVRFSDNKIRCYFRSLIIERYTDHVTLHFYIGSLQCAFRNKKYR